MNNSIGLIARITSDQGINYLNIGLILITATISYIVPFELFLFAYGVLGPLHYLTEISWLDKKNYYIKSKSDIWLLILLVVVVTIGHFNEQSKINLFIASCLFSGFIYALIILFIKKIVLKLLFVFLAFAVSLIFKFNDFPSLPYMLFAIWLPSIAHVYVFTGLFMLYGALKLRSKSGVFSVLVLIMCACLFFVYTPQNVGIPVTDYGREVFSLFSFLNQSLYKLFGFGDLNIDDGSLFVDANSIVIMRFMAFSYTYHYLNWFSKTSVIKWNDVSKIRTIICITLWVISVGLYVFNYRVGFYALFFLGMLHVFLEFPLNHRSIIGIGQEIKAIVKR